MGTGGRPGTGDRTMSILHTFVTLDLETTGLSPRRFEILEIGAVKVEAGKVADRFQTYVNPRQGIPEEAVRLTGITQKAVRRAPRAETALTKLRDFVGDLPILAHQGRFEQRFLSPYHRPLLTKPSTACGTSPARPSPDSPTTAPNAWQTFSTSRPTARTRP